MQQDKLKTTIKSVLSRNDIPDDVRSEISSAAIELLTPLQRDEWIYRLVVIFLGLVVLVTVAGGIYLAYIGKGDPAVTVSEGVIAIGSAAVGALAGLLAPSPQSKK